jgi:hypothetical protein
MDLGELLRQFPLGKRRPLLVTEVTRIYDHHRTRPEDSPTFKFAY